MKFANIGGAKASIVIFRGNEYYFLFNGFAMFELADIFGDRNYFDRITKDSKEGLEDLLKMSKVLATQGELARREIGLNPKDDADFGTALTLQIGDILSLKSGCMESVNLGYSREVIDEDEEIDLGLIELQKKRNLQEQST